MGKETKSVIASGVVFLVLVLGALWHVNEQSTLVDERKGQIADLNKQIDDLKKEAALRDSLLEELANLRTNLSQYVKILPSPEVATEERLLELVQEKCERSQFELKSYVLDKPKKAKAAKKGAPAPKANKDGGGFAEIGLTLQAVGSYEQFLRFLNSLERHESFLRVNSFSCQAAPLGKGRRPAADAEPAKDGEKEVVPLTITLNVSTFRYDAGGK
jgi:Tfp pilus assembly protein PilO